MVMPPNINEESAENSLVAEQPQFSKKERRLLRHQQRDEEQTRAKKRKKFKKLFAIGLVILVISAGISGLVWYFASKPLAPKSEIIAQSGIHWHPEIKILILGKIQEIPANIGLGITEKPIHTHDDMGVIHLEFSGLVKKDDLRLGRFFEIWGKKFNQDCIFDKCSGTAGRLKMFVNGQENFEFENYAMRDGDKIEIVFE